MIGDKDDARIVINTLFPQHIKPLSELKISRHIALIMFHLIRCVHHHYAIFKNEPVFMPRVINGVIDKHCRLIFRFLQQHDIMRGPVIHHQKGGFAAVGNDRHLRKCAEGVIRV